MIVFRKLTTPVILTFLVIMLFSCKSTKVIEQPKVEIPEIIETPKFEPSSETMASFLAEYLSIKYKGKSFKKYMYVSVKYQRLYLIVNDSTIRKYSISTAKKGIGCKANSNKTY